MPRAPAVHPQVPVDQVTNTPTSPTPSPAPPPESFHHGVPTTQAVRPHERIRELAMTHPVAALGATAAAGALLGILLKRLR